MQNISYHQGIAREDGRGKATGPAKNERNKCGFIVGKKLGEL